MIEVAPVRLIADDPIYEVMPSHLELLRALRFQHEVINSSPPKSQKRSYPKAE
jgi:hypothetical protein